MIVAAGDEIQNIARTNERFNTMGYKLIFVSVNDYLSHGGERTAAHTKQSSIFKRRLHAAAGDGNLNLAAAFLEKAGHGSRRAFHGLSVTPK